MTFLQIHALNQEIAQAPDMTLETRHGIRAQIENGKLYCHHTTPIEHTRPKINAGLFRYRFMERYRFRPKRAYRRNYGGDTMEETNTHYIKREIQACIDLLHQSGGNTKLKARIRLEKLLKEMES